VVASDLRFMIERLFREAGIVIAYPQRDVHLGQTGPLEVVVKVAGEQTPTPHVT
jgi:potassium efflux system protein